jgi:hypothetical protein
VKPVEFHLKRYESVVFGEEMCEVIMIVNGEEDRDTAASFAKVACLSLEAAIRVDRGEGSLMYAREE